jgi:hypothetical protein
MLRGLFYARWMFERKVLSIRCSEGLVRQVRLHFYPRQSGGVSALSPDVSGILIHSESSSSALNEFKERAEGFVFFDESDW